MENEIDYSEEYTTPLNEREALKLYIATRPEAKASFYLSQIPKKAPKQLED